MIVVVNYPVLSERALHSRATVIDTTSSLTIIEAREDQLPMFIREYTMYNIKGIYMHRLGLEGWILNIPRRWSSLSLDLKVQV